MRLYIMHDAQTLHSSPNNKLCQCYIAVSFFPFWWERKWLISHHHSISLHRGGSFHRRECVRLFCGREKTIKICKHKQFHPVYRKKNFFSCNNIKNWLLKESILMMTLSFSSSFNRERKILIDFGLYKILELFVRLAYK
jgi:hypothetical protein